MSRANKNYYLALQQRFSRYDRILKTLLLVVTPSTLAGAIGSTTIPGSASILQIATVVLALFATAIGAVNAKLDYTDLIKRIGSLYHTFVSLEIEAGQLLDKLEVNQSVSFEEAEKLKVAFENTSQDVLGIPVDRKLMETWAADAQRTLGLGPFPI